MENDLEALRLLTLVEAAEALQVSTRTLQHLIRHDELPAFKVGHQWRVSGSGLTQWIQKRANRRGIVQGAPETPDELNLYEK